MSGYSEVKSPMHAARLLLQLRDFCEAKAAEIRDNPIEEQNNVSGDVCWRTAAPALVYLLNKLIYDPAGLLSDTQKAAIYDEQRRKWLEGCVTGMLHQQLQEENGCPPLQYRISVRQILSDEEILTRVFDECMRYDSIPTPEHLYNMVTLSTTRVLRMIEGADR